MSLPGQRTTTSALSWDDFKSLIHKLERDREFKFCLLISIGVFTGLRISDILRLRFNHFETSDILIIQEQKTRKIRKIKINPDLKEIIKRIKSKMIIPDSQQYIFINRWGTKPIDRSYVNLKLKKIFRRYDVPIDGNISSHVLRKTLGCKVLKIHNYSGESFILLMELFGHSSPSVTRRYLGIREKEILDVYDSLSL